MTTNRSSIWTPKPVLYKTRDRSVTSPENCASDGAWFDARRAAKAVYWVEKYCRHSKGEWAGKPLILDPNHRQLVEDIWGWRREEDGTRQYREVFEAIPRKNGKSTIASAIALALTVADGEPGAEVYSIAGNANQARLVYNESCTMARQSPELCEECEILKSSIFCAALNSFFKPLAAKADTQHGFNVHGRIGDEVHAWKGREQYDVMTTAEGTRRQPLGFDITTAGENEESLCGELWDHALKVREDPTLDPEFLPVIFAADKDDDPGDPVTWAKANPNLGISIKLRYLERKWRKAQQQPSFLQAFKRLHLNIWAGSADKWMPSEVWNQDANKAPFDADELVGRLCYLGLDLGRVHDPSALVAVFPPAGGDPQWRVLARFFLPKEMLAERCRKDRAKYDVWARDGVLTLTEGNIADYEVIENACYDWAVKFSAKALGYDRMFADRTIQNLGSRGVECVGVGQGFVSMALPMAEMERECVAARFRHGGNPMLAWMAGNVIVRRDEAGNMKPDKKLKHQRIDGIPASLNAMALFFGEENKPPSVYESRGIIILR